MSGLGIILKLENKNELALEEDCVYLEN